MTHGVRQAPAEGLRPLWGRCAMTDTVLVALLSLAGTAIGSILGILANNRLVAFRLEQLEKRVEKHNNLVERVAILEREVFLQQRRETGS